MNRKPVILALVLLFSGWMDLLAVTPVNAEDFKEGLCPMYEQVVHTAPTKAEIRSLSREEKKHTRIEQRIERFQKHIQLRQQKKSNSGISDPVDRWFWYWVIGWGLGLLLTLIAGGTLTTGFLGILWFTLFIAGSISLVVWLVKKYG